MDLPRFLLEPGWGWIYNLDVYPRRFSASCEAGNSLAVRLPATVIEALNLKEGDNIEIRVAGRQKFEVKKDRTREQALAALRKLRRNLPEGFVFNREEAHER